MMGVVLWSDKEDRKAVFWCEDHGDLAYYDGTEVACVGHCALQAGDLVAFDMVVEGKTRRAKDAYLVEQSSFGGLSESLKSSSAVKKADTQRPARDGRVVSIGTAARKSTSFKRASNA